VPAATSDPNAMRAKDLIMLEKPNYYLVRSPEKNLRVTERSSQISSSTQRMKPSINKTAYTFGGKIPLPQNNEMHAYLNQVPGNFDKNYSQTNNSIPMTPNSVPGSRKNSTQEVKMAPKVKSYRPITQKSKQTVSSSLMPKTTISHKPRAPKIKVFSIW